MNMEFCRKLPMPKYIKEQFPVTRDIEAARRSTISELKKILSGESERLMLVIGPCSADNEDAVIDYVSRLRSVQDKVIDKIQIVPRIYTSKPRTTGEGYKGMLHNPNPSEQSDMLKGIVATRKLHLRVIQETGFGCADEMLYPESHRYLSDLLAYVAVGARSVENQQHRLTASGLDTPVGMKNPTSGDIAVMMNAIKAAQSSHTFIYRGWEVKSAGNPYTHAILRGYVDRHGKSHPNYHYEELHRIYEAYRSFGLEKPALIVDTNHSNSSKQYLEQSRISKEILRSCRFSNDIKSIVKGLMIESYIEDGAQSISDHSIYGKSVTDPCLGWERTERLIYELAELL